MGQKLAAASGGVGGGTGNWSMDDWAYGTGENAVQIEEVIDEAKQVPMKYFGGNTIANDPSMQQMQQDFLALDQKFKKLFFWRKKKRARRAEAEAQQQQQQQEYYDSTPQTIFEEAEDEAPQAPIYENQSSTWICDACHTKNKSTNVECEKCKDNNIVSSSF